MNNKKLISTAILLILAKSAMGIEVEPNNDSGSANLLETENIGQLSQGSDVDFFQFKPKDNNDISIAFSCDNKALASHQKTKGWYLGVHDEKGHLQSSYPITPAECVIGDSITSTPYSFSFARGSSSTFYLSVVADCHVPVYNVNPINFNASVNDFVKATPTTQANIDALKTEIVSTKSFFDTAQTDLNNATFILINSNAYFADITDALALANDIREQAIPNVTAGTTISAAISTTTAAKILSQTVSVLVFTHGNYVIALDRYNTALATASATDDPTVKLAKTLVDELKKVDDDALVKVGEASASLKNAVLSINNAVNADLKAAQNSTSTDSRSNNSCAASNTAPYKIEVNKPNASEVSTDKTKIYTGRSTANIINKKNFNFKLTNCGLNKNASLTVNVKNTIAMTIKKNQTPINIQIGDMACQLLTPETIIPTANEEGSIVGSAKIIDSNLIAKDSASFTLTECSDTNAKISVTGTKLDFVDFNPTITAVSTVSTTTTETLSSVVIPVNVSIGDFHCEAKEAFYIYNSLPTLNDKTYSSSRIQKTSTSTTSTKPKPFFGG